MIFFPKNVSHQTHFYFTLSMQISNNYIFSINMHFYDYKNKFSLEIQNFNLQLLFFFRNHNVCKNLLEILVM